jgi:hypothetical protein
MKRIINCETGEVTERELNKAEKDKQKLDEAQIAEALVVAESKLETKETAKSAILDRIGLTADELQTILG